MKVKDSFASKQSWPAGLGVALAALALYVTTLAPTVLEGDAGEFQFVPWLPGIAHPTGYPLYVLLGWLWTHLLPVGDVAWRMNLLSAVFAAGAVGLTYAVARQLLEACLPFTPQPAQLLTAVIVAAIFGVTRTFWSQAIIAEVYALHTFFVAAILGLALKWRADGWRINSGAARLLLLTFGLSLTHHATTVLLLPVLILYGFVGRRKRDVQEQVEIRTAITHLLLLLTPLLLYLYLPLIAPTTPYATLRLSDNQVLTLYDNSPAGFWDHVTGTVFAGALQPAAAGWDRVLLSGDLLHQQVGWMGILLALVGLFSLWRRRQLDLLVLTGVGFPAFVAFNLIYFIGDVFVLFIPAWFFVCLWLGVGILELTHQLAYRFVRRKTRFTVPVVFDTLNEKLGQRMYRLVVIGLLLGFGVVFIVILTMRNFEVSQTRATAIKEQWQKLLQEPIAENAILLSNDRNEIMPLWYFQYVEGRRPDLLGLFPLIVTDPAYANVGGVLEQALASNRPVYLVKPMAGLTLKADLRPEGNLFRATKIDPSPTRRLDTNLPDITVKSAIGPDLTETISLLGFDVAPTRPSPGDEIVVTLYWEPTARLSVNYTSYVHLVDPAGHGITQNDHRPGGTIYPSRDWRVGEILRDRHALNIPSDLPAGSYHLRAGIYYQPEPGVVNSSGIDLGSITITR